MYVYLSAGPCHLSRVRSVLRLVLQHHHQHFRIQAQGPAVNLTGTMPQNSKNENCKLYVSPYFGPISIFRFLPYILTNFVY